MATSNPGQNLQSSNLDEAVAELACEAYRAVKYGTAQGTVTPCTAITDIAIGITTTKAAAGARVEFQTRGIALVTANAAITQGVEVMVAAAAAGRAATSAGATARSLGVCVQASTALDQVVAIAINLPNLQGAANV